MDLSFSNRFENISGSAIRAIFALLADPNIISFGGGNPAGEAFPAEKLADISHKLLLNNPEIMLQYGQTQGYNPLKQTLAKKFDVDEDMIQITVGAQMAIDIAAKAMLDKGDTILVENPTFLGAIQTFKMYQPSIKAVETDENGIIIEDLEKKIKKYKPKLLYVIPNFQNPQGITTSHERRQAISDLAQEHNLLIIEDDPYGELRYEGESFPSIFSLNKSGNVLYVTSFSKTISPGLRVGAAIGSATLISKLTIGAQTTVVHAPILNQAIVNEFINSKDYSEHIESMCRLYKSRRDNMIALINEYMGDRVCYTNPAGGLFIWCALSQNINGKELFKKCVENKVAFVPGESFYCENPKTNAFRLNFSFNDEEKTKIGIQRLSDTLNKF